MGKSPHFDKLLLTFIWLVSMLLIIYFSWTHDEKAMVWAQSAALGFGGGLLALVNRQASASTANISNSDVTVNKNAEPVKTEEPKP